MPVNGTWRYDRIKGKIESFIIKAILMPFKMVKPDTLKTEITETIL